MSLHAYLKYTLVCMHNKLMFSDLINLTYWRKWREIVHIAERMRNKDKSIIQPATTF